MSEKATTEDVEEAYASVWDSFHGYQWDEELAAKFQDWLAKVERAAAEKALTDAAYQFATQGGIEALMFATDDVSAVEATEKWLIDRAAALGLTAEQEEENDE